MHTSKDDYLINTLRFVSRRKASQIYGAVLPECLTSPEMKESKAYKTYLGYATGEVPPKVAFWLSNIAFCQIALRFGHCDLGYRGKLIQKLLLNQKCMGYLACAYYSISPTRYYKDDLWWSTDLKSKAIDDIISIGSFVEAHVLNYYVLVRKIFSYARTKLANSEVPPKVARKFKKASPSKKESERVPGDEEPIKKGKKLKTPAKKSTSKPATGIVIREPPVETKSKRKEKEKVDVAHGKRIELLSEVALGSGTVAKKPPSVEKITPTVTSEETSDKPGVPDVTNDESSESESESWGNDEDDSNNEQESSDESSMQENESEEQELDSEQDKESDDDDQKDEEFDQENEYEDDEMKSDEEQGMDDTTDQFDDDADARLEEPTETTT
ncbi:hypothetical protein Tco_1068216 [Tanacetum coccineum]|uniref:Uncharacterized protein n=1 Tax=Tanacetum coccineum TaxID=301880 RepID=A0ABQ5HF66_9ASTR